MTKLNITVPAEVTIAKRNGATVRVDTASLHDDILADLFVYGLRQKVNDSASGEQSPEGAEAAMLACINEALYAGEWSLRGTGVTSDPMDVYRAQAVRKVLANPSNKARKAEYDSIPSDDQKARVAFLLELFAKHEKALTPAAEELRKIAEAKQTVSVDVTI